MVKISCKTVTLHKAEETEQPPAIYIHPQHQHHVVEQQRTRPSSLSGLCCLITALIICTCSLVYASVYIYHYYIIPQVDESQFQCSVYYDDQKAAQREELKENVNINLHQNYERISVPPAKALTHSHTHPATIIHDFNTGVTAYHDITLDKCYITELNSSVVLPPRNLWKLLINVKLRTGNEGVSLPQTYVIQEEMVVSDRVKNTRQFGAFIDKLCEGKQTFQIKRRLTRRRISKREEQICRSIRHFENTFVMETMICDAP